MGLTGCRLAVKYSVIGCNVFFALTGLGLFVMALVIRFNNAAETYVRGMYDRSQVDIDQSQAYIMLYGLAAVGFLTLLVGILGVVGPCMEKSGVIFVFVGLLVIVIFGQGACALTAYLVRDNVKKRLFKAVRNEIDLYRYRGNLTAEKNLAKMQIEMECCGCHNRTDYDPSTPPPAGNGTIKRPRGCKDGQEQPGCCHLIWAGMAAKSELIGYGILGFVLVELLSVVLSVILAITFQRMKRQEAADAERLTDSASGTDGKSSLKQKSYLRKEKSSASIGGGSSVGSGSGDRVDLMPKDTASTKSSTKSMAGSFDENSMKKSTKNGTTKRAAKKNLPPIMAYKEREGRTHL